MASMMSSAGFGSRSSSKPDHACSAGTSRAARPNRSRLRPSGQRDGDSPRLLRGTFQDHAPHEIRPGGFHEARDLERYLAIGVANHRLAVLMGEVEIDSGAPPDLCQRNTHDHASKRSDCRIQRTTSSTPSRVLRFVKTNGLAPRINRESRSITAKSAPTCG